MTSELEVVLATVHCNHCGLVFPAVVATWGMVARCPAGCPGHVTETLRQRYTLEELTACAEPKKVEEVKTTTPTGAHPPPGHRWELGRSFEEIQQVMSDHAGHEDQDGCPICDDLRRGWQRRKDDDSD